MSHYYGTIDSGRGTSTRCGSKRHGLTTTAASWHGAVSVTLWHEPDTDQDWARVELIPWKGTGIDRCLYLGPIDSPAGGLEVA